MGRKARILSSIGYYHIMMRGINKQNIFEDEDDMQRFADTMFRFSKETGDSISAWCLMNNHVHLLIYTSSTPDQLIKKIGDSYVLYFNRKYDRVGPLFQGRYRSEPINDEQYLLGTVRYIHNNPVKAGICALKEYRWSSIEDYLNGSGRTTTEHILSYFSGVLEFINFMCTDDSLEYMTENHHMSENEAIAVAKEIIPNNLFELQHCNRNQRNETLIELFSRGLTVSQISRITGIGRHIVQYAIKKMN